MMAASKEKGLGKNYRRELVYTVTFLGLHPYKFLLPTYTYYQDRGRSEKRGKIRDYLNFT